MELLGTAPKKPPLTEVQPGTQGLRAPTRCDDLTLEEDAVGSLVQRSRESTAPWSKTMKSAHSFMVPDVELCRALFFSWQGGCGGACNLMKFSKKPSWVLDQSHIDMQRHRP